jgi:hypothetical protein
MAPQALEFLWAGNKWEKVPCRRWGVNVDAFSNVMGVLLLRGTAHYESEKRNRGNTEVVARKILIYILQTDGDPTEVLQHFGGTDEERSRNLGKLLRQYDGDYDCIIYGKGARDFKFERSKIFYVKACDCLYSKADPEETKLLVEHATIECRCTFAENTTRTLLVE